ncbi:hypothetical protein KY347_00735 [Candidatus Woesearchaeota archaeon]|nr:hypothetical protein [Candidatus Woesearchaeota archaeon]
MEKEEVIEFLKPTRNKLTTFILLALITYIFLIVIGKGNLRFGSMYFEGENNFLSFTYKVGFMWATVNFPEIDFLLAFTFFIGGVLLAIYIISCLIAKFRLIEAIKSKIKKVPILKSWQDSSAIVAVLLILFSPEIIRYLLYKILQYVHYPAFYFVSSDIVTKYNTLMMAVLSYLGYFYLIYYLTTKIKRPLKYNFKQIAFIFLIAILFTNFIVSTFSSEKGLKQEECKSVIYNYKLVAIADYSCWYGPYQGHGYMKYFLNIYGKWVPLYKMETFIT